MSPQRSGRQASSAGMSPGRALRLAGWVVGLAQPGWWWEFTSKGVEGLLVFRREVELGEDLKVLW